MTLSSLSVGGKVEAIDDGDGGMVDRVIDVGGEADGKPMSCG